MRSGVWVLLAFVLAACGGSSSYESAPAAGYYGDQSIVVAQSNVSADAVRFVLL